MSFDLGERSRRKETFIEFSNVNTRIGLWLVLNVIHDSCADLVHTITVRSCKPYYAHTHVSAAMSHFHAARQIFQFNGRHCQSTR